MRDGFFGYDVLPHRGKGPRVPPQPRFVRGKHFAELDIARAVELSAPLVGLWATVAPHEGVPAFSGGLMDSWPAYAVDALAVCRAETAVIRAYLAEVANA
jgi:hypothetical protein